MNPNAHPPYLLLILFGLLFVAAVWIAWLFEALSLSRQEEAFTRGEYEQMREAYETLFTQKMQMQEKLQLKREVLRDATEQIERIETTLGVQETTQQELQARLGTLSRSGTLRATALRYIPNGSPVPYEGITSKYGMRTHPMLGKKEFHKGSDLRAGVGTPVVATADGVVEFAGLHKSSGYGTLIIIHHHYGFRTFFAHLDKAVVKEGEWVRKGTLIGYSGNSGISNGAHLHYEVRFLQHALNPFWFIKWGADDFELITQKEKRVPWKRLFTAMRG